MVRKEQQALKACKVYKELQGLQAHREFKVQQEMVLEFREPRVLLGHKEFLGQLVRKEVKVSPD